MIGGNRCIELVCETNHIMQLSTARSMDEVLALCEAENLEAVYRAHNPGGGCNRQKGSPPGSMGVGI